MIGLFLRHKRCQKGLTQKGLAAQLGYSCGQFVSNWERGISMPPKKDIDLVCQKLNIEKKELASLMIKNAEIKIYKKLGVNGYGM
jgi:transcriptional regulator with XRE-family HTH domain